MVYMIRNGRQIKVGFSSDPYKRWNDIQIANKDVVTLEYVVVKSGMHISDWENLERAIHNDISEYRYREGSEWFTLPADVLRRLVIKLASTYTVLTRDQYFYYCEVYADKFEKPQIWSSIANLDARLQEGYYRGNQEKILKAYSVLEKRGGFISYADIAMVTNCDIAEVRDIMRSSGVSKSLIKHNKNEKTTRDNRN